MTISPQQRKASLYAAIMPGAEQMIEILADESYPRSYVEELYAGLSPETLVQRLITAAKAASGEKLRAFCTATYKFEMSASDIMYQALDLYLKGSSITWTGRGLTLSAICRKRINGSTTEGSDFFTKYLHLAITTDEDIFGPVFGREQERDLRLALRATNYLFKS